MIRVHRPVSATLASIIAAGFASSAAAASVTIPPPILPDFAAATFDPGALIDNTYFPLLPGRSEVFVAEGIGDEGEEFTERSERSNAGPGPVILGVPVTQMLDRAFEDELLVEETFDYFAQDALGNVWYFGEDVTNFIYDDDGNLIDTTEDGAWRAGENGAFPGFIMPASTEIGFSYYQEFAPEDDALDQGFTFALLDELEVDGVTYGNVLQVLETTAVEPDDRGFKYYAPGIGMIREDEGLNPEFEDPELVFSRLATPAPIPLPAPLALIVGGCGALLALRRCRVRRGALR